MPDPKPGPEPGPEPGSFPFKRYDSGQLILLLCVGYNSNCVWAILVSYIIIVCGPCMHIFMV